MEGGRQKNRRKAKKVGSVRREKLELRLKLGDGLEAGCMAGLGQGTSKAATDDALRLRLRLKKKI